MKCWKKENISKSGVMWKQRQWSGFVYLYNRGWFRGKENQYVISTSLTGGSNPSDRKNEGFNTKSKALKFANSYMKKHDRC